MDVRRFPPIPSMNLSPLLLLPLHLLMTQVLSQGPTLLSLLLLLLPINVAVDLCLFLDVGCFALADDPFRVAINRLFLIDPSFGNGFFFGGRGHHAAILVLLVDGTTIGSSTLVVHVVHGRSCLFGLVIDMLLVHVVKVVLVSSVGRTRLVVVVVAVAAALLGRFRSRSRIGLAELKLCIAKATTAKAAAATFVAPSRGE